MSYMISPAVRVTETDLTNVIPAVATSPAATAGFFNWGPVLDPTIISNERELVSTFGEPSDTSFNAFLTASNVLAYNNNLLVNRADSTWMMNANSSITADSSLSGTGVTLSVTIGTTNVTGTGTSFDSTYVGKYLFAQDGTIVGVVSTVASTTSLVLVSNALKTFTNVRFTSGNRYVIRNYHEYLTVPPDLTNAGLFVAQFPGALGNSLQVQMCDSSAWYVSGAGTITVANNATSVTATGFTPNTTIVVGSYLYDGSDNLIGQVSAVDSTTITLSSAYTGVALTTSTYKVGWQYRSAFPYAPSTTTYTAALNGSNDEMHVVVIDQDGLFSGSAGTVLETYTGVSKASDAMSTTGATNYYKNVINTGSRYIFWANHPSTGTNWGTVAAGKTYVSLGIVSNSVFSNGSDGTGSTLAHLQAAYHMFANDGLYDIGLIAVGKANYILANYVIQSVAEVRKDCVAFVSPEDVNTAQPIIGATSTQAAAIVAYANNIVSSSYGFIDSGYKYQYDRYNDVYRWVPLNGDMVGLCARTDQTNDPWWSPAGYNRGVIKNVVKLAFNPASSTDRDTLYSARVNPVVIFKGQGPLLYGDKTAQSKPSAFDRINVRRLFIVLEKAIATAAKYQLFEFNNSYTQGRFRAMIEPFLRDVQGRQGIQLYQITCDSTNNTDQIVSTNQFVADIRIMPAYSINFITLNFIASNNSATFSVSGA